MKRLVPIALLAGCFSEPARPHGIGAPIGAGGVLRHETLVGDLNNDGYDDLVLLGNDGAPKMKPTVYVFFGGESLENPDARVALDASDTDQSTAPVLDYEAVEGSIYISADGTTRGIAALVTQDALAWGGYISVDGRTVGTYGPDHGDYGLYGVPAPTSGSNIALIRDTYASFPAHEMLFGNSSRQEAMPAPPGLATKETHVAFAFPSQDYVEAAFVLPPEAGHEDLLIIGSHAAYRTHGDFDTTLATTDLAGQYHFGPASSFTNVSNRVCRGITAKSGHYYVVSDQQNSGDLGFVDVPPGADPVAVALTPTAKPTDLTVGNVAGSDAIDVVAIVAGNLGVYADLALADGVATPASIYGLSTPLDVAYDLLAVGNFHGDDQREVYVISDTKPELPLLCFHFSSDSKSVVPCARE